MRFVLFISQCGQIMYNKGDCTYCTVSMRSKEGALLPLVQCWSKWGDVESRLTQGRPTQHIQDRQLECQCTWCVQGPTQGQDRTFEEGIRPDSLDWCLTWLVMNVNEPACYTTGKCAYVQVICATGPSSYLIADFVDRESIKLAQLGKLDHSCLF